MHGFTFIGGSNAAEKAKMIKFQLIRSFHTLFLGCVSKGGKLTSWMTEFEWIANKTRRTTTNWIVIDHLTFGI